MFSSPPFLSYFSTFPLLLRKDEKGVEQGLLLLLCGGGGWEPLAIHLMLKEAQKAGQDFSNY